MLILKSVEDYRKIHLSLRDKINNYLAFVIKECPFYRDKFKNIKPIIETFYGLPLTYDYELMDYPKSFIGLSDKICFVA